MHFGNGAVTRCRDVFPSESARCSDLNTTQFLRRMIEAEKPDFIAFTGPNSSFSLSSKVPIFCSKKSHQDINSERNFGVRLLLIFWPLFLLHSFYQKKTELFFFLMSSLSEKFSCTYNLRTKFSSRCYFGRPLKTFSLLLCTKDLIFDPKTFNSGGISERFSCLRFLPLDKEIQLLIKRKHLGDIS